MARKRQSRSAFKGGSKKAGLKKGYRFAKGGRIIRVKKKKR